MSDTDEYTVCNIPRCAHLVVPPIHFIHGYVASSVDFFAWRLLPLTVRLRRQKSKGQMKIYHCQLFILVPNFIRLLFYRWKNASMLHVSQREKTVFFINVQENMQDILPDIKQNLVTIKENLCFHSQIQRWQNNLICKRNQCFKCKKDDSTRGTNLPTS